MIKSSLDLSGGASITTNRVDLDKLVKSCDEMNEKSITQIEWIYEQI